MKRRTTKWLLLSITMLGGCSAGSDPSGNADTSATASAIPINVPAGTVSDANMTKVMSRLTQEMAEHHIPGASIAVVQNGQLSFQAGAGVKQSGGDDQVLSATLFSVGSLSKMVLAATVMKLVEQGKLDLSRAVTDYVPLKLAAPFDPSTVTLHQLLTHTAGIPDLSIERTACGVGPGQAAAWFAAHDDEPLWTPPGEVWNYSNRGYSILGWVVEAVTGVPYETAAESLVLGPAGMTSATFEPSVAAASDPALGHVFDEAGRVVTSEPEPLDCAVIRPSSGLMANVVDYAHFAEMLLADGGSVLAPSSVATMETPYADTDAYPNALEHYGYGLKVFDGLAGLRLVGHAGTLGSGYHASLVMVPAEKFAVAVFYNALGGSPDTVARFAVETILGRGDTSTPSYQTPPTAWAPYVGTYVDPFGLGTVNVSIGNGELLASAPQVGAENVPLKQSAGDCFNTAFAGNELTATFYPGPQGPAEWLVTRRGVAHRQ